MEGYLCSQIWRENAKLQKHNNEIKNVGQNVECLWIHRDDADLTCTSSGYFDREPGRCGNLVTVLNHTDDVNVSELFLEINFAITWTGNTSMGRPCDLSI